MSTTTSPFFEIIHAMVPPRSVKYPTLRLRGFMEYGSSSNQELLADSLVEAKNPKNDREEVCKKVRRETCIVV